MIDLRREQFLLKDSFRPPVGSNGMFLTSLSKPDYIGMRIGPHSLCGFDMEVDYGNWKHIHAMLKYYNGMKIKVDGNPFHP